ncbi:hypothetical protein DL95DRAFT_468133 [Leptodontidium sp. 2 PMI_412]|nr:hypothetical protein DL95DRAFT_468133 [Leptodontidium sp. 2 PMI_412]
MPDGDTIVVDLHAPYNDDYDSPMPNVPTPTFEDLQLSDDDKRAAILKWKEFRAKVEHKPREMSSHVYYYMQKELVPDSFYAEVKEGPKILQEYRWDCKICLAEP